MKKVKKIKCTHHLPEICVEINEKNIVISAIEGDENILKWWLMSFLGHYGECALVLYHYLSKQVSKACGSLIFRAHPLWRWPCVTFLVSLRFPGLCRLCTASCSREQLLTLAFLSLDSAGLSCHIPPCWCAELGSDSTIVRLKISTTMERN